MIVHDFSPATIGYFCFPLLDLFCFLAALTNIFQQLFNDLFCTLFLIYP